MSNNSEDGNRTKVWVVSTDRRKDLSDAERFGDLRDVFPTIGKEYVGKKLIEHARKILSKSTSDDYLLVVGDPALSCICVAVMAEMHDRVKLLRWNREGFKYVPLELDFRFT